MITAPQAGRISALPVSAGQPLQAGQTVASLVPRAQEGSATNPAELQAQLFAPSRTAGFVQAGQAVYLRFAAFPFQKFGTTQGEVLAVSRSPIAPADLPAGQSQALLDANRSNESMYRITVRLKSQSIKTYGRETPLAAGMALEASIVQDSRRIWEWLLEPALAVAGGRRNLSD